MRKSLSHGCKAFCICSLFLAWLLHYTIHMHTRTNLQINFLPLWMWSYNRQCIVINLGFWTFSPIGKFGKLPFDCFANQLSILIPWTECFEINVQSHFDYETHPINHFQKTTTINNKKKPSYRSFEAQIILWKLNQKPKRKKPLPRFRHNPLKCI